MNTNAIYRAALEAATKELAALMPNQDLDTPVESTPKKEKPVKARKAKKAAKSKAAKVTTGKRALPYDEAREAEVATPLYVATHRAPDQQYIDNATKAYADLGVVLQGRALEHEIVHWHDSYDGAEWEAHLEYLRSLNIADGLLPSDEQVEAAITNAAREAVAVSVDLDAPAKVDRIVLIDEHGESLTWKVDDEVLHAVMATLADRGAPEDL